MKKDQFRVFVVGYVSDDYDADRFRAAHYRLLTEFEIGSDTIIRTFLFKKQREYIRRCNLLVLTPGWEKSREATVHVLIAFARLIPVCYIERVKGRTYPDVPVFKLLGNLFLNRFQYV